MKNINKDTENQNEVKENIIENNIQEGKTKFSIGALMVPVVIAVILVAFVAVIYWAKVIKPAKDLAKELGYNIEEQITLGEYKGFEYEITQEMWDECIMDEILSYEEVERAAMETDQIGFNYTGYVDGKKDSNISQKDAELIIGDDKEGIYKFFSEAIAGHKSGEKIKVEVDGTEATALSMDESDYSGKKVTFEIKIKAVSKRVEDKVTDKWVSEWYLEDYGLENTEDFYEWNKQYLIEEEAKPALWQMVIDAADMKKYPQKVYDDIVAEFDGDAEYNAEEMGMTKEQYLYDFSLYTDETLEEEYLNGVKSELVMWSIVKEEGFEVSDAEIEQKYEDTYLDVGCESVEQMKELYSKEEIKEAVLLDKVQNFVYDNSKIKESYTIK